MHGWIALGVALIAYLVKIAFDYGTMKGLLKQITEDMKALKEDIGDMKCNIVYEKNCRIIMKALNEKVAVLEAARDKSEKEQGEMKKQLARIETLLETLTASVNRLINKQGD